MKRFSKIIKQLRTQQHLTQEELADKLQVSQSTVSQWEIRGSEPNYKTTLKISELFNVSLEYLLGKED